MAVDIVARALAAQNVEAQGTTDYSKLTNKPQINNVELSGNKTSQELGLQPSGDYATKDYVDSSIGDINTVLATLTTVSEVS